MLFALVCVAALIWLGILAAPWRPWGTSERLDATPDDRPSPPDLSDITAIIPARDEAPQIERTLTALRQQGTGLRIVVVDDESGDGTGDLARRHGGDRCTIIAGASPPAGWTGKLWALEQARSRVESSLTLLLDADIELRPGILGRLRDQLRSSDRHLVSLMAVLEMRSTWEKLLVPAFVYFFKLLYPFRLSNGPGQLVAAAAGGCVLVDSAMLTRLGGFAALRGALIDDCALARRVKRSGGRTWIGLTHSVVSHRRMDALADIWRMVQRSAYAQLGYSAALLTVCVAVLIIAFWAPLAGVLGGDARTRLLACIALAAMLVTYLPTLVFYRRSPLWALALPLTGTLYLLMTVSSAARHWRGLGAAWKGRTYPGHCDEASASSS